MSNISIYIDTNCINARQNDIYINELEELYEDEKILIEKTDILDVELQDGRGYPKGLIKSQRYIESYGVAVLGHSSLGHAILGNEDDEKKFSKILQILWGNKIRSAYIKHEIRDAMHIYTAIRYGGTYFVTDEKNLLIKGDVLEREFGIKLRTPKNCLTEIKSRLKELDAIEND